MRLSERLFGKWEVIDSCPCSITTKVIFLGEAVTDGVVQIEQNTKTGYKRAMLVGDRYYRKVNMQEVLELIKEYKKEQIREEIVPTKADEPYTGWKVEIPSDLWITAQKLRND